MNSLQNLIKLNDQFTALIVDDSNVSCKILKDSISYISNIDVVHDGKSALEKIKDTNYDFIITDVIMPKMDGVELTKRIRLSNKDIPIIAVSSLDEKAKLIDLINLGVTAFVPKPFEIQTLEEHFFRILSPILSSKKSQEESKRVGYIVNSIYELSLDGITILDNDLNYIMNNEAHRKMTGFSQEELSDKNFFDICDEADIEKSKEAIKIVNEKGYLENFQRRVYRKDFSPIDVNINISKLPNNGGYIFNVRDITKTNDMEFSIKNYISLVDESVITSSTDLNGKIIYASDAFCKISNYTKEELIGKNHNIIRHPDNPDELYKDIWATITKNKTWKGEIKNLSKDGLTYWVYSEISPTFDRHNSKIGYTAVRQDITDKKRIESLLITDSLTSIYNRRYFNEQFPKVLDSSKRDGKLVAFLIFDVDHFKQYNDNYGHPMGDKVLHGIGLALKNSLHRGSDYCFRLGGEEFGVLFLPDTIEDALEFSEKIRASIENLNILHEYNSASDYVTASFGLEVIEPNDNRTMDDIYKDADNKLYDAKESGRNRISFSNE